jgi:hypothetical protein
LISNQSFADDEPYLRKNIFMKTRKLDAVFEWPDHLKVDIDEEGLKKLIPTRKGTPKSKTYLFQIFHRHWN